MTLLPEPLNITKSASVPGGTADIAGENISYTITVQNTGNTTLTGVVVTDPYANPGSIVRGTDLVGNNDALLEVGETWSYTATHTVTQAEIDSNGGGDGFLENTATADSNETGPVTADASVPVARAPALNITKSASVPGGTADIAGENISYTITVQNTGNTTLTGVVVTDPYANPGSIVRGVDLVGNNDALLEVGETWSYTATHTVTQAEIDSNGGGDGLLENTATADSNETGPDTADANVPVARTPALNITKDATVPGGTADVAGENISYTITVQNTGNTTLTGVVVTDPYANPGSIVRGVDLVGDNDALLEVGETWSYTATHTVTQAEIDSNGGGDGFLENTATVDSNETGPDTDDASIPVDQNPAIQVIKRVNGNDADNAPGVFVATGSTVNFTFFVSNTGNTSLSSVTLNDNTVSPLPVLSNGFNVGDVDLDNQLDTSEIWQYTASASAVAGQHTNTATASGSSSDGQTASDTDDGNYFGVTAGIDIEKAVNGQDADTAPGPSLLVGSTATFTYTVTNTGNVPLGSMVVVDNNGTPGNPADDFNPTFTGGDVNLNGLLDVGEVWTYVASRIVTSGPYTNIGTVTGQAFQIGATVTDSDAANYSGQTIIVIGPDKTNGSLPYVHLVDLATGSLVRRFPAYELSYRGGVRVATGDLNGDGVDEIITAPGRNHAPVVKVFSQTGVLLYSFSPYASSFAGGVDVAIADINGDSKNDIITAMSYLGNQVKVYKNNSSGAVPFTPLTFSQFTAFDPFGSAFKGGAAIDAIDMGNAITVGTTKTLSSTDFSQHRAEIVVGNGSGMRSTVKVFTFYGASPSTLNPVATLVRTFLPFSSTYRGGVSLETGRVDGDLVPDIIVGTLNRGGSQVQVLDGDSPGVILKGFTAYPSNYTPSYNAPVHTLAMDSNGDGIVDFILTAQGSDGTTRKIRQFTLLNSSLVDKIMESSSDFAGAYFLAPLKTKSTFGA